MDEVFNIFDSDEFQDLIIQEEQIEDITIEKDETFDKLIIEVFHRKCDFGNELIQNISTFGKKSDTQQFIDRLSYLIPYSSIFDSNVPFSIVIDSDDDDKRYHQFVVHIDYRRYDKAKAIEYIRFFKSVVKIFSSIKGLRTDSSIRFSILDGPNVITVSSNKLLEDELYEVYPIIKHLFNDEVFMSIANKKKYIPMLYVQEPPLDFFIQNNKQHERYKFGSIKLTKELNSKFWDIYKESFSRDGYKISIDLYIRYFEKRCVSHMPYTAVARDFHIYENMDLYPELFLSEKDVIIKLSFGSLFSPMTGCTLDTYNQCMGKSIVIKHSLNKDICDLIKMISNDDKLYDSMVSMISHSDDNQFYDGEIC